MPCKLVHRVHLLTAPSLYIVCVGILRTDLDTALRRQRKHNNQTAQPSKTKHRKACRLLFFQSIVTHLIIPSFIFISLKLSLPFSQFTAAAYCLLPLGVSMNCLHGGADLLAKVQNLSICGTHTYFTSSTSLHIYRTGTQPR